MPLSDDEVFAEVFGLAATVRDARLDELCAGDGAQQARLAAQLDGAAPPPFELPSELPARLGPYRLLAEIDRGAHGTVYRAERADLAGEVAVKVIVGAARSARVAEWARREGGFARRVRSPHVVQVHDVGRLAGGACYIEMELCADVARTGGVRPGASLAVHGLTPSGRPRLSPLEAAELLEQAARGAQAAHDAGIVHGDIKPQNVLVTPESRRAQLADFGIATSLAAPDEAVGPDARVRVGTLAYMAPEQFLRGEKPTELSDVYMLGGTLLFLLAGRPPHPDRRLGVAGLSDGPRTALPPSTPLRLREIVERCLAVDPAERYGTAAELADDLRRFRELEPTHAERGSLVRRAGLLARRKSELVAAVGAVLVLAGLAVYTVWHVGTREIRRTRADAEHALEAARGELARVEARRAELEGTIAALNRDVGRLDGERRALEAGNREIPGLRGAKEQLARELEVEKQRAKSAHERADELARAKERELADAAAARERERADRDAAHERERAERGAAHERAQRELQAELARVNGELRDAAAELARTKAEHAAAAAERERLAEQLRAQGDLAKRVDALGRSVDALGAKVTKAAEAKPAAKPADVKPAAGTPAPKH